MRFLPSFLEIVCPIIINFNYKKQVDGDSKSKDVDGTNSKEVGIKMEKNLGYLREALSNWTDKNEMADEIFSKLEKQEYKTDEAFVDDIEDEQHIYLSRILPHELRYAQEEGDQDRFQALNKIYDMLE
jgi:hypothetical protein